MTDDPFDLQRFVDAQAGAYAGALAELRAGRKTGHWIWFVLPQLAGLGRSTTARAYGIGGLAEARAYVQHPLLGPRLRECAAALVSLDGHHPEAVLGPTDALKLRSSMTLFAAADPDERVFAAVLEKYYGGRPDPLTLELLRG